MQKWCWIHGAVPKLRAGICHLTAWHYTRLQESLPATPKVVRQLPTPALPPIPPPTQSRHLNWLGKTHATYSRA